ncbi:MAG: adenylate/guanylate cyclase domain-containing protein [Kiritimatiellaeota bacterium]|nr:adenylate/guanylate cyclase domain-containing protein [Kiritimatiellota bacterium]
MSSPQTGPEPGDDSRKHRTSWPAVLLAFAALVLALATHPALGRLELISADYRFALRYALNTRLLPWVRRRFGRGTDGKAAPVSDEVALIGIDGPSLAELGKFGSGQWIVREPFRRMVPVLQSGLVPSVVAYDLLFRPVMGAEEEADDETSVGPEALGAVIGALRQAAEEGTEVIRNPILLQMTRIAALQGDVNLAMAFAELTDPAEPDKHKSVPVICAYDFKGLDAATDRKWSRADIVGRDETDLSEDNGETIPYLLDVALPEDQVRNIPADYRFLPYALLPTTVLRDCVRHGFINVPRDPDGIIRRVPLVLGFSYTNPVTQKQHRRFVPSFALLSVLYHWGLQPDAVTVDFGKALTIRRKDAPPRVVPIDRYGRLYLNFVGQIKDYPNISFTSFLRYGEVKRAGIDPATLPAEQQRALKRADALITGKIAMVGLTATGTTDIGPCPVDPKTPYVHIHMTAADDILTGRFLRPTGAAGLLAILAALFLVTAWPASRWHVFRFSLAAAGTTVAYGIVSFLAVQFNFAILPLATPMVYLVSGPFAVILYRYFTEEAARKNVRQMFSTMVSPQVLTYLEENPESFSLTGHRVEATIMFSDVAGFTTISERLSPEELTRLLNEYLSAMTDIIMQSGGYVDKYEGDAIMAEWGVPYPDPGHATAACLAALDQQKELARIRPRLEQRFGALLYVRIGMNSGAVAAGNMGSNRRFQYTVMGDTVNQASRFEPANKDYGSDILVGRPTWELARHAVDARLLDKLVVMGKTEPVQVYEILARKGEAPADKKRAVTFYEAALKLHWEREWERAIGLLGKALEAFPEDTPSKMLLKRIQGYIEAPPPAEWKGEFVRKSKE